LEDPIRYPYYTMLKIYLRSGSVSLCGGSLVAPDMVLTAAHCTVPVDNDPITGIIAKVNHTQTIGRATAYEYTRKVTEPITFPNYDSYRNIGDVALLVLDRPVTGVPLLKLNTASNIPAIGLSLTVVGFGDTSNGYNQFPNNLMEVSVPVISQDDCSNAIYYTGKIVETAMLCAGAIQGGKDSCGGDSGGPLLIPGTTVEDDILVGVVSFGYQCALANYPGVYSRISTYQSWIQDTICTTSNNPPSDCFGSTLRPSTPSPTIRNGIPTFKPKTRKPSRKPTRTPTKKKRPTRRPTLPPTEEPSEAPLAPPIISPVASPISFPILLTPVF
jgi:trypsin